MIGVLTGRRFALLLLTGLVMLHAAVLIDRWQEGRVLKAEAAYVVGSGVRAFLPSISEIADLLVAQLNGEAHRAERQVIGKAGAPLVARQNVLVGVARESDVDRIYIDAVMQASVNWEPAFIHLCQVLSDSVHRTMKQAMNARESQAAGRAPACRLLDSNPAAQYPAEPNEILFVRVTATSMSQARIAPLDWAMFAVIVAAIVAWLRKPAAADP